MVVAVSSCGGGLGVFQGCECQCARLDYQPSSSRAWDVSNPTTTTMKISDKNVSKYSKFVLQNNPQSLEEGKKKGSKEAPSRRFEIHEMEGGPRTQYYRPETSI